MMQWSSTTGVRIMEDERFWRWMTMKGYGGMVVPRSPFLYGEDRKGCLFDPPVLAVLGYWQEWLMERGMLVVEQVQLVGGQKELCFVG